MRNEYYIFIVSHPVDGLKLKEKTIPNESRKM